MSQVNINWFYKDDFTVGANYAAAGKAAFSEKKRNVKIAVEGANVTFSIDDGATDQGVIKPADGLVDFRDCDLGQIAFKSAGAVTGLRVWAWDGE